MLTVLVVDDDFRVANMHAALVDSIDGFTSGAVVNTLEQARAAIETASFDVALVDVYLPDGSGLDLVRELRCDALVLSAAGEGATVREAMAAGALGYLIKPFPPAALAGRLRGYARYRSLIDTAEPLDQARLDRAVEALRAPAPRPQPAAASQSVTRDLVLRAVRGAGAPLSAGEVAAAIGISRATAQRYLAALVGKGSLRMRLRYGSTGRPEQEYSAPPG